MAPILKSMDRYLTQLQGVLDRLPRDDIHSVIALLQYARANGRQVFILGNGGSAATASHFACDLGKGTICGGRQRFRVMALTDNMPLFSAWANDTGYENVFSQQLANWAQVGDVVIAISGSGNSANVLHAVRQARSTGAVTVGLTGFHGGQLKGLVDVKVVVPCDCMEQIEDVHLIVEHLICTILRQPEDEPRATRWNISVGQHVPTTGQRRAVFLDRDGVINVNRADYVKAWAEFAFLPSALKALRLFSQTPLAVVVVSNQSAINRGLVTKETVEEINRRMVEAVQAAGGRVDHVLVCPHRPDEGCACRKPQPGLLLKAAEVLRIDLSRSYIIGDSFDDLAAGHAVKCRGALLLAGRGLAQLRDYHHTYLWSYHLVPDMLAAVKWVLRREELQR